MNYPFGKFYEKAFTGSMMGAGSSVFAVMAYAISHAKPPDGTVELNPKYLSSVIGDSEDKINSAIDYLCSEDKRSRNPRENGRRLLVINGWLYRLTTWNEHRVGHDDLARREYFAEKQAEYRKRLKDKESVTVHVKDSIATVTQAEAEAYTESTPNILGGVVGGPINGCKNAPSHRRSAPNCRFAPGPSDDFLKFWNEYPRRVAMKAAWKSWQKSNPPLEDVLVCLGKYKKTEQWRRGKEYIPHASTWLNQERWDDEL